MTYGQIRLRISKQLPGVDLDLIDGWMQDRFTAILDRLPWQRRDKSATVTTVANTNTYQLPADCRALKSIRGPLGPLEYFDATKEIVGTVTGTPQTWRPVWDDASTPPRQQIQVWPVPDAVYTLTAEYTAEETTFDGSSTSVALLPWVRPAALHAGVMADGLAYLGNFGASDREEVRFSAYVEDMIRTECRRTPAKVIQVSDRYSPTRFMQGLVRRRLD